MTVRNLEENENIEALTGKAFRSLPLDEKELNRFVLVVVAPKEHLVGLRVGAELEPRLPKIVATQKLQSFLGLYIDGLRPDSGIYGGVHFVFAVILSKFRCAAITDEEALENASTRGGGAGAIFALVLAPFLAFFVSMFFGIYSTHTGFQRETRLFLGIVSVPAGATGGHAHGDDQPFRRRSLVFYPRSEHAPRCVW